MDTNLTNSIIKKLRGFYGDIEEEYLPNLGRLPGSSPNLYPKE